MHCDVVFACTDATAAAVEHNLLFVQDNIPELIALYDTERIGCGQPRVFQAFLRFRDTISGLFTDMNRGELNRQRFANAR